MCAPWIQPRLESLLKAGLVSAASSTNAWVITGGTDAGVTALVGQALSQSAQGRTTPCIGVASWRHVSHREKFYDEKEEGKLNLRAQRTSEAQADADAAGTNHGPRQVLYVKRTRNTDRACALEPNHNHFILVNDERHKSLDGALPMRAQIEASLGNAHNVPTVLLLVQGGTEALEKVVDSMRKEQNVVIIRESKGAAQAITEFVEPLTADPLLA